MRLAWVGVGKVRRSRLLRVGSGNRNTRFTAFGPSVRLRRGWIFGRRAKTIIPRFRRGSVQVSSLVQHKRTHFGFGSIVNYKALPGLAVHAIYTAMWIGADIKRVFAITCDREKII